MCTVTYIPMDKGISFASLRDESPLRASALQPKIYDDKGIKYIAPIDAQAGGTWVGINDYGNVIILLNGGFEKHVRLSDYRLSRGLIVKSLLSHSMPVIEWNLMDLIDIEPFTLIVWSENNLFQLVWDGQDKHRLRLDESKPYIWSSSTLYDANAKSHRTKLFQMWMTNNPQVNKDTLLDFFQQYSDPHNGYIMNRNDREKTISYTYIDLNTYDTPSLYYSDMGDVSVKCQLISSYQSNIKPSNL